MVSGSVHEDREVLRGAGEGQPYAWMHFEVSKGLSPTPVFIGRARGDIRSPLSPETANVALPADLPAEADRDALKSLCCEYRREVIFEQIAPTPGTIHVGIIADAEQEFIVEKTYTLLREVQLDHASISKGDLKA